VQCNRLDSKVIVKSLSASNLDTTKITEAEFEAQMTEHIKNTLPSPLSDDEKNKQTKVLLEALIKWMTDSKKYTFKKP
jgi:hypothetical protein